MSEKLKKELLRICLAGGIFFVLLALDKGGLLQKAFKNPILVSALYLVPYAISGERVVRKAVLGVAHGQMLDESFLMTVASLGAFATGEAEEAVAVMLFYQVGEWFQSYAVDRSRQSITSLMDIAAQYAVVVREDGSTETIDPDDVEIGDTLLIKPGEKIPVDGTVLTGESQLYTAAITGESVPKVVRGGDTVLSGCINGEGLLRMRADKAFEDSTAAKILELVENASEKKSRTENFITRFARYYTPVVVAAAVVLAIIPSLLTGQWAVWIYRACTFLVISCPCALVISVPLAFFGGVGAASKRGVLVKGSNYLELLSRLKTVVTDKTGTLTQGNFAVSNLLCAPGTSEEELLKWAAAAESDSTHPIASPICEAFARRYSGAAVPAADQVRNISGQGIEAVCGSSTVLIGNAALMEASGVPFKTVQEEGATLCYVAKDGRYLGAVCVRDIVKENAAQAVEELRKSGVRRVVLLTGDAKSTAEAVGREIGLDEVYAELLPQDKVQKVEEMLEGESSQEALAFIGDGINDAPVLMRSDIGIAMGQLGSDAAIEAADIVIMDDDLLRIPPVIRIAKKTVSVSRQNIVFALAVKALILLLGALGAANMWAAVFADVGVAVLCILNSMRLLL